MSDESLIAAMPNASLRGIAEKALNGQRLSKEEGLTLFASEEEQAIRQLADGVRKAKVGDAVFFTTTLYIHPTNLCELSCPMCSFYAKPGWKSAWMLSPDQVEAKVRHYLPQGISEVHIVGGLWRECNLDYYQEIFTRIKAIDPALHIKALTPVEYDYLAKLHNLSIEEVFLRMQSWGLGSLPGGGAEVLVEHVRKQIAPQKITSDEYLAIHRLAHKLGLCSNITMLFGHVEEYADLITHMLLVRELQDETNGFREFVPLKYLTENNALGKRTQRLKPKNVARIYAVSRLMLDNFDTLRVLWNYVGVSEAIEILNCGANHLSSTSLEEKIISMAGGGKELMNREKMSHLIAAAGRLPVEAHTAAV